MRNMTPGGRGHHLMFESVCLFHFHFIRFSMTLVVRCCGTTVLTFDGQEDEGEVRGKEIGKFRIWQALETGLERANQPRESPLYKQANGAMCCSGNEVSPDWD